MGPINMGGSFKPEGQRDNMFWSDLNKESTISSFFKFVLLKSLLHEKRITTIDKQASINFINKHA